MNNDHILETPYTEKGVPKAICVIGGGSWGTTLANLLSEKGYDTRLWVRSSSKAVLLREKCENVQYLPGIKLDKNLFVTNDIEKAVNGTDLFIMVVPSQNVRETLEKFRPFMPKAPIIVNASKGMEEGTNDLMSEVISDVIPDSVPAVLSGPNHAEEIAKKKPSATVISCENENVQNLLLRVFATPSFRTYGNSDMRGVQICAALKNVIAIGAGVSDGLDFGDNAKAGIITRGINELASFGRSEGARDETFFGLAGVGDLIATCTSEHSRNRRFGEYMGRGMTVDEATDKMGGMVVEGVKTSKVIENICRKKGHLLTIPHETYLMIYEDKPIDEIVYEIMRREPKEEI